MHYIRFEHTGGSRFVWKILAAHKIFRRLFHLENGASIYPVHEGAFLLLGRCNTLASIYRLLYTLFLFIALLLLLLVVFFTEIIVVIQFLLHSLTFWQKDMLET